MPKMKSKKTLLKRIKITKSGKLMRKSVNSGHLKRKWSAGRKCRKKGLEEQTNRGHIKIFKSLLVKKDKGIK